MPRCLAATAVLALVVALVPARTSAQTAGPIAIRPQPALAGSTGAVQGGLGKHSLFYVAIAAGVVLGKCRCLWSRWPTWCAHCFPAGSQRRFWIAARRPAGAALTCLAPDGGVGCPHCSAAAGAGVPICAAAWVCWCQRGRRSGEAAAAASQENGLMGKAADDASPFSQAVIVEAPAGERQVGVLQAGPVLAPHKASA